MSDAVKYVGSDDKVGVGAKKIFMVSTYQGDARQAGRRPLNAAAAAANVGAKGGVRATRAAAAGNDMRSDPGGGQYSSTFGTRCNNRSKGRSGSMIRGSQSC